MNCLLSIPQKSPYIDSLVLALKNSRISITVEGAYYTIVVDGAKRGLHTYRKKRVTVISDVKADATTRDAVQFDTLSISLKSKIIKEAIRAHIATFL